MTRSTSRSPPRRSPKSPANLVPKTLRPGAPRAARRRARAGGHQGRRDGRRRHADAADPTAVGEFFGQPPLTNLNPDQVVALGAAIQANVLAGNRDAQRRLAAARRDPAVARPRDDGRARREDRPAQLDDPGVACAGLHDVQGWPDRDGDSRACRASARRVADCRSLARFELRGIPPMAAGAARIRVTFQVDADGLLVGVGARADTRVSRPRSTVKPSYGLTDGEIARMLQDSFAHARRTWRRARSPRRRSRPTRSSRLTRTRACGGRRPAVARRARGDRRGARRSLRRRARTERPSLRRARPRRSTAPPRNSPAAAWTAASRARSPAGASTRCLI